MLDPQAFLRLSPPAPGSLLRTPFRPSQHRSISSRTFMRRQTTRLGAPGCSCSVQLEALSQKCEGGGDK